MATKSEILAQNYPHLQNLIKRDPASYQEEFIQQWHHFQSCLGILTLNPLSPPAGLPELISFVAHCAPLYKQHCGGLPDQLMQLLGERADSLSPELRRSLVQALVLLRSRGMLALDRLVRLLFGLFRVRDKALREQLFGGIVGEIRRANRPHLNNGLNRSLQAHLYEVVRQAKGSHGSGEDASAMAALFSLRCLVALYRKGLWTDAHTVNVVAEAALAGISDKVTAVCLNFFLGRNKAGKVDDDEDVDGDGEDEGKGKDSDDEQRPDVRALMHAVSVGGSSKAKERRLKRAQASLRRLGQKQDNSMGQGQGFAALQLLHDPHGWTERLFGWLRRTRAPFNLRLLALNVISRAIAIHQLILPELYPFLLRYLQPHQRHVANILALTAQACHPLVPPDYLQPVVAAISMNFVADHCRPEVIAAGLNGLRELCQRSPAAMDSEQLAYLVQFRGNQDKNVAMAARSLIGLFRREHATLLPKRERGREATMALKAGEMIQPAPYGVLSVLQDLPGLEEVDSEAKAKEQEEGGESDESVESEDFESDASEIEFASQSDDDVSEEDGASDDASEVLEVERKLPAVATRILTDEDFARLRHQRQKKAVSEAVGQKRSKQESSDDEEGEDEEDLKNTDLVKTSAIRVLTKKPKADYAARMASIKAGREDRLDYGSRKGKLTSSSTNKAKSKRKNAIMMVHKGSVRAKSRRSLKEKQKAMIAHAKKQKRSK